MTEIDFLSPLHTSTKRNYVQRVVENDKAKCAKIAKQWGYEYWDGDRSHGYGGYTYDGRWRSVAENIVKHYHLKPGDKVLDIGCGKAFLLYELSQVVPGLKITGIDVSQYGLQHAKDETRPFLQCAKAEQLPFDDHSFDFVFSINTFHNLKNYELWNAFQEMQRVGRDKKYYCVESYRNENEKTNLLYWQLTCESFYTPEEWQWFAHKADYQGDYGFIYFE